MRSKLPFFISFMLLHGCLFAFQNGDKPDSLVRQNWVLNLVQGAVISTDDKLPFWLRSNQSQRLTKSSSVYTGIFLNKAASRGRELNYFGGVELYNQLRDQAFGSVIQAYGGITYDRFKLTAGIQEEVFGLNDSTLSIGNLFYGNNARPIPKIRMETNGWVAIPYLSKNFSFKAYLAHGWFEHNRYQSGAMLHQKYFYLKSQFLNKRATITVGLHHAAQWGGRNETNESSQPTGIRNYLRIFMGSAGGNDAVQLDQDNALGNHLGSYDLRASYDLGPFIASTYFQFLWEDRSGLTPYNWRDGLVGMSLELKNKKSIINKFNLEIIRTNHQDAEKVQADGTPFVEPDNFLNNSIYRSSWAHRDVVMGSPVFLLLNPESRNNNRIKNMVNGLNVGVEGSIKKWRYSLSYRWFRNQGTYRERFDPSLKLHSVVASGTMALKRGTLSLSGIYQGGNLEGRNLGINMTYSTQILGF